MIFFISNQLLIILWYRFSLISLSRTIIFHQIKLKKNIKLFKLQKTEVQVYINNDSEFDTVKILKLNCLRK